MSKDFSDEETFEEQWGRSKNRKLCPDKDFSSDTDSDGEMRAESRHVTATKDMRGGKLNLVVRRDGAGNWKSESKVDSFP